MAGLGSEMAAGGGRDHLRASHADREQVIETLKAAYVYGPVTKDELDARVARPWLRVLTLSWPWLPPTSLPGSPPVRSLAPGHGRSKIV
jgi:hypothetical protein